MNNTANQRQASTSYHSTLQRCLKGMKNEGSMIWVLLGLTQLFLVWGMWGELEGPMTTLFGSSGAAMLVLGGWFWLQEKRSKALSKLQGYNKFERTQVVRGADGKLTEQAVKKADRSGLWTTFFWFFMCWVVTRWLF